MQQYAFEQIVRALDRPEAQPVIGAAHGEKFDAHADGELVILDDEGCPQWDRLQKRHVIKHPQRIRRASVQDPAAIFAFDLLWLDGATFVNEPCSSAKTLYIACCQRTGGYAMRGR